MCGIIGANTIPSDPRQCLRTLIHRGPDYQGFMTYEGNFFGHTRLSIIDPDPEANQPMRMDGVILVFNGEIYNFESLKKRENLICTTRSDTEVIIRMYQKYGTECLGHFEGMFSFALYDTLRKRWFCARDRFGKKPFYYFWENGRFVFASEIKGILTQLPSTPVFSKQAMWEYLAYQSPLGDKTFYDGVRKLPAGHCLILDETGMSVSRYYDIEGIKLHGDDEATALRRIEEILLRSVEKRLVGDVEVSSLLSGGLDSSLVSALYARMSGRKIHTFSIGYDEHTHHCELSYASAAASHIGSIHHELRIGRTMYLDAIESVLEALDEPMSDSASIPTYILSRFVHDNGFKVALSGEGSDENFLGYIHYEPILRAMNEPAADPGTFSLSKEWEYRRRRFMEERLYRSAGETFTPLQLAWIGGLKEPPLQWRDESLYDGVQWLGYADFKVWIGEVLMTKVDRMSMAHSLEVRAPFLDSELVEYAMGIDPAIKRGNTTKALLKNIARRYLPAEIIDRPKKGFSSPYIEWIFEGYKDEAGETLRRMNREVGFFDPASVEYLITEASAGRFKQHFYALYLFSRWYKKVYG